MTQKTPKPVCGLQFDMNMVAVLKGERVVGEVLGILVDVECLVAYVVNEHREGV